MVNRPSSAERESTAGRTRGRLRQEDVSSAADWSLPAAWEGPSTDSREPTTDDRVALQERRDRRPTTDDRRPTTDD